MTPAAPLAILSIATRSGANAMSGDDFWFSDIGIPWCREEDYGAFVAIFEDAKDLPTTWDDFADLMKRAEQDWEAKGRNVQRVYIDPRTFPAWCKNKGYRVDAKARVRFAFEAVTRNANHD